VNRDKFVRRLRGLAKERGLAFDFDRRRGKGGHDRIRVGDRVTVVPSGELKRPTMEAILKQLELPKDAV